MFFALILRPFPEGMRQCFYLRPQVGKISAAISDFFSPVDNQDTELTVSSLELISNILVHSTFEEREVCVLLLNSDLLCSAAWHISYFILLSTSPRQSWITAPEAFVRQLIHDQTWVECERRHPSLLILSRLTGLYDAPHAALLGDASGYHLLFLMNPLTSSQLKPLA
jgi:hypothetical protein